MFKKFFILVAVAVFTASYAQAQVRFGARAGFNLSTFSGDVPDASFKPGFQIGVVADCPLSEAFAIQSGLLFSTQGAKFKYLEDNSHYDSDETYVINVSSVNETYNLNYLQIPINAQYKFDLSSAKLLLQAGPYLGYGIGGKYKMEAGGESISTDVKFGDDGMSAFEIGLGLGAGVEFGNIQAGIGYNFGLTSLTKWVSMKNGGLAVTITYLFGK